MTSYLVIKGAKHNNLKNIDVRIPKYSVCVVTGVSGSGKSSLVFDTIVSEAQRRFFHTLSFYTRKYLTVENRVEVDYVGGLSPCISLAQNETLPTHRATVATFTNIGELIGILFSQFGDKYCPKHQLLTTAISSEEIVKDIFNIFRDKIIIIMSPVAVNQKGNFKKILASFINKGFLNVFIDGKFFKLHSIPDLQKEQKHTIKLIVDIVVCDNNNQRRLERSINSAFEISNGYMEVCKFTQSIERSLLDLDQIKTYSKIQGCPICHMSWPPMDSRYFSTNSLGKCPNCYGLGYVSEEFKHIEEDELTEVFTSDNNSKEVLYDNYSYQQMNYLYNQSLCPNCKGTGLKEDLAAITINKISAIDMHLMSFDQIIKIIHQFEYNSKYVNNPAFQRVITQMKLEILKIIELGLGYICPSRRILSLSFGELQRLKLSSIIIENLRGILYVLDEPSQGLHPQEISLLINALKTLKSNGNTIIVVDHDELLMHSADWIIDLGPGGGEQGGHIVAEFNPKYVDRYKQVSLTARYLTNNNDLKLTSDYKAQDNIKNFITLYNPTLNNLNINMVHFAKNKLNVICGVSGAGKSSLVNVFYEDLKSIINNNINLKSNKTIKRYKKNIIKYCSKIDNIKDLTKIEFIDRRPIAKTNASIPATYLDVFSHIRAIYSELPQTQIAGIKAQDFSLAKEGGRCEECKGKGEIVLQMRFLPDVRIKCSFCNGKRYKDHILQIKYKGLSIADVLDLSIDEAIEFFKHKIPIIKKLKPAKDLGLGYIKLGQLSSSLSGGESQRLKLVPYFSKNYSNNSVLIMEEPTSGLHFDDVNKLLNVLNYLKSLNVTIIVIENNMDFLLASDWIIELGPGSADKGGRIVFEGSLSQIFKNSKSLISKWLQDKISLYRSH